MTGANKSQSLAFEQAVAAFLQALDPKARVRHDVIKPDIDTGHPRQRDVWIDTSFGGHIPITILVSCKRKKVRLSQQDIDAFIGELRSSGANKGVLYTFAGFTKPAIEKARKLGISCCTLYVDRAPDVPQSLTFEAYCLNERYQLELVGPEEPLWDRLVDVLDLPVTVDGAATTVISALARRYAAAKAAATSGVGWDLTLGSWFASIEVPVGRIWPCFELGVRGSWAVYQARFESFLLNGSYSFTDETYAGGFTTPSIDRFSEHPGSGWEAIEATAIRPSGNVIIALQSVDDIEPSIRDHCRSLALSSGG